ncbi:MAG: HypC/HybG/HupF family hydrogenase formation chaperone [Spirochaetales bacterium]|nr:HypC/HybG/HupF family hydrogenase formation chaperone [Spirochaetales bacterium]
MCLAIPMKVVSRNGGTGVVESGNVFYEINFSLLPDAVVDDYVIVHTGFAIQKLDKEDADETLKLYREMENLGIDHE